MAVKSKTKSKAKVSVKTSPKKKTVTKPVKAVKRVTSRPVSSVKKAERPRPAVNVTVKAEAKSVAGERQSSAVVNRVIRPVIERRPVMPRTPRVHQFSYMKAPGIEHEFEVGDNVEVFCDHEKNRDRIRGWLKGIVVQVDNKMVAVQFRSNVFLTDGWMVPDRILWYPLNSEHIRPVPGKKPAVKKDFIPDY